MPAPLPNAVRRRSHHLMVQSDPWSSYFDMHTRTQQGRYYNFGVNRLNDPCEGVPSHALQMVPTPDGRRAPQLNGTNNFIRFGPNAGVFLNNDKFTAWVRFWFQQEPADGANKGFWSQWNDNGSAEDPNVAHQAFNISAFRNAFGRSGRTFEFVALEEDPLQYRSVNVTYATDLIGQVITLVGVATGSTLLIHLLHDKGCSTGTTSLVGLGPSYTGNIEGSVSGYCCLGKIDGSFTQMAPLGCGVIQGYAMTHQQALDLHRDPWEFITGHPDEDEDAFLPFAAPGTGNRRRRVIVGA